MANPQDCAPGDPRVEADLSDIANWDPQDQMHFTPEDATKPRGAGVAVDVIDDPDALEEQIFLEQELKRKRREYHTDKQPFWSQAVNMIRVPQELFRTLERYTNVPFHSWFRRIEDAVNDVEIATTDPLKELRELAQRLRPVQSGVFRTNREERKQVQRLFEERLHDPVAAGALEKKLNPQVVVAADNLQGIYRRYFESQGMTSEDVDDFWKSIGALRERDSDYLAYKQHGRMPKIMQSLEKEFRTGEIMMDSREWDFYAIGERLIRAHARQKHLGPAWNLVRTQAEAYEGEGVVSRELMNYFYSYTDQIRYAPDHWQMAVGRFMNKALDTTIGRKFSSEQTIDMVPALMNANYFANMAFNTGVAIRNFLQPLQTSYPILGERFTWSGYQAAWKALKDPKLTKFYAQQGVITREAEPLQATAIREAMMEAGPRVIGGNAPANFLSWFKDAGWWAFRQAENTNRIMSYQGMVDRATFFGEKFLEGKISWNAFYEGSRLDSMDGISGPITGQIRRVIESGNLKEAAHLMGLQFTRNTQFVYRRGNQPYVMQNSVGRLFGQYGTWPAWYLSYLSGMFMKGSYANRAKQLARWSAANAAVMGAASEVFGVDMARWGFFSPLGYTGGPFVQVSKDAYSAIRVLGGSEDPVDRIQAGRLAQAYTQLTPFPWGATKNVRDSYYALLDEDWPTATKRFLGFQPETGQ